MTAECTHHVEFEDNGGRLVGTVTIRNLDDEVIERAKERAQQHNRSLEAELRTILTQELKPLSPAEFFRLADEIRESTRGLPQTDSESCSARGGTGLTPRQNGSRVAAMSRETDRRCQRRHQMVGGRGSAG